MIETEAGKALHRSIHEDRDLPADRDEWQQFDARMFLEETGVNLCDIASDIEEVESQAARGGYVG